MNESLLLTLGRAQKKNRIQRKSREERSSGFMMPQLWGEKLSRNFSRSLGLSCPNCLYGLKKLSPSNYRYIRRIQSQKKELSLLAVNGEERRPVRVTPGSFGEVCHCISADVSQLPQPELKGCPVMQRWERVTPHSCHFWPGRVEECIREFPLLMPHKAELPRQMFFWKLSLVTNKCGHWLYISRGVARHHGLCSMINRPRALLFTIKINICKSIGGNSLSITNQLFER